MPSDRLTTPEAAAYLGVKPNTLEIWRCHRKPHQPPYRKVGRKVIYDRQALDEYMARTTVGGPPPTP